MAYEIVNYDKNDFFTRSTSSTTYSAHKGNQYKDSTAFPLFIWCHGCGGVASGDLWSVKDDSRITISLGGRDNDCWQPGTDNIRVLDAIVDIKKCFNIDINRIYLGGYSSGGDLTYRVGFENAGLFAALLVENSSPFRDTGSTATALLAKAAWKINIIHLAHTEDTTYPITSVRSAFVVLKSSGFPATLIEKPGTHWDDDKGTTGTDYDLINTLLPYLKKGLVLNNAPTPTGPIGPTGVSTGTIPTGTTGTATGVATGVVGPNTAVGIVKTTSSLVAPGDQGFKTSKVIGSGYNVPAGTYNLTVATRTTFSDDGTVVVTCIIYGDVGVPYDLTWQSMDIDLRGAKLGSFWDCTITGTSGVITVKPTSSTKTIKAGNKNGFGFVYTRNTDITKANNQVLVKKVVW